MSSIDEKRVYGDREGARTLYLATEAGVVRVAVAGDRVGEFGVVAPGPARDVAVADGRLVVAGETDVTCDGDPTGLGPCLAVGDDPAGGVLAVTTDGTVCRPDGPALGTVPDARAVDGGLVASPDGLYRVTDGVAGVGLTDVRDVAGGARPLAATGDGLYALGPGWHRRVEDEFRAVAAGPDGAVAVDGDGAVHGERGEGWERLPDPPCAPVDCGRAPETTYVVDDDGTVAVRVDGGGWRARALGTPGVTRLACAPEATEPKGERAGERSDRT